MTEKSTILVALLSFDTLQSVNTNLGLSFSAGNLCYGAAMGNDSGNFDNCTILFYFKSTVNDSKRPVDQFP